MFSGMRISSMTLCVKGTDYGQLKDLISDRSTGRTTSEKPCQNPAGSQNSRRLMMELEVLIMFLHYCDQKQTSNHHHTSRAAR